MCVAWTVEGGVLQPGARTGSAMRIGFHGDGEPGGDDQAGAIRTSGVPLCDDVFGLGVERRAPPIVLRPSNVAITVFPVML
jgi:hypothetical protein